MAVVTGTVFYRDRMALPPDAQISVQLVDVSRADAPADVISKQSFMATGRNVPFSFELLYEPSQIDERHSYAVQARIELGGRLLFINDQAYLVLTRDNPTHVDILLV
jgi:putative lipoprotein